MAYRKSKRTRSEAEELESAYRSMTRPSRRSRKSKKKGNRPVAIVAIFIAITAICIAAAAGYLYLLNEEMNKIILENITVAGVDVGGMSQGDAIEAVRAATENTYSKKPMVVKVLDSTIEIPTSCVGALNIRGAVREAYKFGNSGSQSLRQAQQQIAMTTGYTVNVAPFLQVNEDEIRSILAQFGKTYNTALSQSSYEVTGKAPKQTLVIKLGTPEYGLNLNALYNQVLNAYGNNVFSVEGKCGMIEPDAIDLESILKDYYIAPTDAYFDLNTYEPVEGKDGYGFNIDSAKSMLSQATYGSTVEIPFTAIPPEITAKSLSALLYRDVLASYTATADSNSDRDMNLRLACEAINGTILLPGDAFSYNESLGERTAERGYKPGPSYSGNKTVMTYGGGICQVSSALYYCTLVAELEILERTNHGFAPSYVPLGMDATVSWGSLDFRFRNNLDYPVRIDAVADGGSVTVKLVGTYEKDYYVETEFEMVYKDDYTLIYQTMSPNNKEGYKNGDYIVEPYTGYTVKAYRCKYSNETKELLSRELIDKSVYRKRDGVICKIEGNNTGFGGGTVTDDVGALPD